MSKQITLPIPIDILLKKLAKPAQRAILSTGVTTLEQLSKMSAAEIFNLHGIGKNAMKVIVATLHENGLSLSSKK
jgi:DNA-directed RNA polymerase alpha subunit